uniref:Uncharacterized protein n=1 Tax=Pseudomonas aeruginosa TaxID=287 RepID=A0A218MAV5_PSEAI|nr:Hypothetical protein [Pseudomonas aeruginosa]
MLAACTALGDGAEGCAAIPAQRPQLESNQNPSELISTASLIRGTRTPGQHGGTSRPNNPYPCLVFRARLGVQGPLATAGCGQSPRFLKVESIRRYYS